MKGTPKLGKPKPYTIYTPKHIPKHPRFKPPADPALVIRFVARARNAWRRFIHGKSPVDYAVAIAYMNAARMAKSEMLSSSTLAGRYFARLQTKS